MSRLLSFPPKTSLAESGFDLAIPGLQAVTDSDCLAQQKFDKLPHPLPHFPQEK